MRMVQVRVSRLFLYLIPLSAIFLVGIGAHLGSEVIYSAAQQSDLSFEAPSVYSQTTDASTSSSAVTETADRSLELLNNETTTDSRPLRFLWGIMSHNLDPVEIERRQAIRETYLSYYKNSSDPDERYRICSLNDLLQGRLPHPEKCRMAYIFVLGGGNPNGPTMLLSFNESYPLTVPSPPNTTEDDLVFLNIQENGRYGKSPTWFKYATTILQQNGWRNDFDYIFKTDTDNLLFPEKFFHYIDSDMEPKLVKHPTRVYGGRPKNKKACGWPKHDHCAQMVGPIFNGGGCYYLSIDLAEFVADETTFDHLAVKLPHEDMTTGNFVFSHPLPIETIKEPPNYYRRHPIKDIEEYRTFWETFNRKEEERRKRKKRNDTTKKKEQ